MCVCVWLFRRFCLVLAHSRLVGFVGLFLSGQTIGARIVLIIVGSLLKLSQVASVFCQLNRSVDEVCHHRHRQQIFIEVYYTSFVLHMGTVA